MNNAIAMFEGSTSVVLNNKGTKGSFARAMAFASREVRQGLGHAMYAKWLSNGQYRPIVDDILSCGLVSKSAVSIISSFVPSDGAIKKEAFSGLCLAVDYAVRNKRNKAGEPITLKGQKAFVYGVVQRIANEINSSNTTIEG